MTAAVSIGDLVWVETGEGYLLPGKVKSRGKEEFVIEASGKEHCIALTQMAQSVKKRDVIPEKGTEDMIKLSQLHEGSMVYNLKQRYKHDHIYTYTGSILIAINPYHMFDIYNVEIARAYEGQLLGALPPHIFAIANSAYMHMNSYRKNQCLVVSGESGAGKTESTKLVLQYLAIINKSKHNIITEKILEATPILESFGNAKTIRNDNSSRFGKYTEVFFDKQGCIEGAKISDYLLEKSRIVFHADQERNYHVFYEMISGLSKEHLGKLGLASADKYFYLNQGMCMHFEGKDDSQDFQRLNEAIDFMGIQELEKDGMFHLLASIVHLGNICFRSRSIEDHIALFKSMEALEICCSQLRVSKDRLKLALTNKRTVTRGEEFHTPFTVEQALDARDALGKALYSHLFNWLVMKINSIVYVSSSKYSASIAVLDIFGFEMFQVNSLEQLCINYANEQLQYYFNQYIFHLEQEEYIKEKIDWKTIEFRDNQPCIDLISKYPIGMLHILDDESHFPKGTDESFLDKCHHEHSQHPNYIHPKQKVLVFGIRHYAGCVWYNVEYFLDKNRDVLRIDFVNILQDSKLEFISNIFKNENCTQPNQTVSGTATRKRMPTVAAKFSSSLNSLIETMKKCHPYFVRCIKPNDDKSPLKFIEKLVLEQLRYSGMLETIRIRKSGYPVRLDFEEFLSRFHFLARNKENLREMSAKNGVAHILKSIAATGFQIGCSKVFLRETTELYLEKNKLREIQIKCILIQKCVRGYLTRNAYLRMKVSVRILQSSIRAFLIRRHFVRLRKCAILLQSCFRMKKVRARYLVLVEDKRRSDRDKIQKQALMRAEQVALKLSRQNIEPQPETVPPHPLDEVDDSDFIFPPPPPPLYANQELFGIDISCLLDKINKLWKHPHKHEDLKHLDQNQTAQILEIPSKLGDLPSAVDNCPFSKYATAFFQEDREWIMVKNKVPISFLKLAPSVDKEAKVLFLLVQEFLTNDTLSFQDEITFGNFIIHKALTTTQLQEELIVQLCNQTWCNYNEAQVSKAWILISLCLCSFSLPKEIHTFMVNFVSNYAYDGYKAYCQYRLLRVSPDLHIQRSYPPCLLEWRSAKEFNSITLHIEYSDIIRTGKSNLISIDSWSKGHEVGAALIKSRVSSKLTLTKGWSIVLQDDSQRIEIPTYAYVLDPISLIELPPYFAKQVNTPYIFSWSGVKPRNYPTTSDGQVTLSRLPNDKVSTYLDNIFDPIFSDPDNVSLSHSLSNEEIKQTLSTPIVITADRVNSLPPNPSSPIFKYPKIETTPATYANPNWHLVLRKEYFIPGEDIDNPIILDLLFFQILQDVFSTLCIRISPKERQNMLEMFSEYNITLFNSDTSIAVKKSIINAARMWQCYFSAIFPIAGVGSSARFTHIGVGHVNVTMIKQQCEGDFLQVLDAYEFNSIHECTNLSSKLFKLCLGKSKELQFVSEFALQISDLINDQISLLEADYRFVLATKDYITQEKSLLSFTKGSVIKLIIKRDLDPGWLYGEYANQKGAFPKELIVPILGEEPTQVAVERAEYQNDKRLSLLPAITEEEDRTKSVVDLMVTQIPEENGDVDGVEGRRAPLLIRRSSKILSRSGSSSLRWAMTEFAAKHFRFGKERFEFEKKFASSLRVKKQTLTGTIRDKFIGNRVKPSVEHFSITRLFTHTKTPIESSLLRLDPTDINLNRLAVECFVLIMIYMGDYMSKGKKEDEIASFLLRTGLENEDLRDELFCQLVKQTTNNNSHKEDSCGKGWRLIYMCTSFFPCTNVLFSYLLQHFHVISDDTKSLFHGIADNCLIAIRKVARLGPRQNLPSEGELNALLSGRYSKHICVFLPGNLSKVVKIYSHTTVHDILFSICEEMSVTSLSLVQEFSLFVDFGDRTQVLPLEPNEFVFDVINMIEKESVEYQLFFKRSVWFHQLKLDNPLLTLIAYHQVLKNYMKGNILVMDENSNIIPTYLEKVMIIAALQHKANGNPHPPERYEMAKIIPKCIMRSMTPQEWIQGVRDKFQDVFDVNEEQAKIDFVFHASMLPHAGSAFFRIFKVSDQRISGECLLAINKFGVHFLDTTTHRSIFSYALQDVVSTRKVRSHDGRQFLDIKFGNLMLQRIIRCETPQNHEIGPIVRQYVKFHMESAIVKVTEIN